MKGRRISWTEDELAWIEASAHLPRADLLDRFQAWFDRPEVTVDNLKALCKRKGWKTGRTGRFEKGIVPANKDGTMPYNENSARTRFKKGNRTGRANQVWKPIGTERVTRDGYVERKIHDGMPLQSRWRAVHLIRWEELNGPVPGGHALKCLDGDRGNTDPANWRAVPRAMLPRLAGRWAQPYDAAEPELKPTIMAIAELEHVARNVRKGRVGRSARTKMTEDAP